MSAMRDKMSANFQVRSIYLRDSHGKTILTNLTQSFLSITIPMVKMCIASFFSSILVFFLQKFLHRHVQSTKTVTREGYRGNELKDSLDFRDTGLKDHHKDKETDGKS